MARQRICMNGGIPWFEGKSTTDFGPYPPTTTEQALYGCMNDWFTGDWTNDGSVGGDTYVNRLKTILADKPWPH
jgi:hypothetical protein